MQITITQDFNNAEDAAAFLARIATPVPSVVHVTVPPIEDAKVRKTRADAGKTREPYGPRTQNAEGTQAGTQPPVTVGAPTTDAPAQADKAAPSAPISSAPTPTAAEAFPATEVNVRAVMKRLHDTKGKGMDACIASLRAHDVERILDLPKEKYGVFIKYVLDQLPAAK